MFYMGSGATNFMRASTKHLLSTEFFFQILFTYTAEVTKRTKTSKPLTKINFTESYTRNMVLKFLPEPNDEINIL